MKKYLLILWPVIFCSCSTVFDPNSFIDSKSSTSAERWEQASEIWSKILVENVNYDGQIDFQSISKNSTQLALVVSEISRFGPQTAPDYFKDLKTTLAYYINAYNAVAMYHASTSGRKPEDLVSFFVFSKYTIDGSFKSLYSFENDIIRPLKEPRIHFALNCMVKSCPRLYRKVFTPENLEKMLHQATEEFLNHPDHVKMDSENKIVYLSKILDWYEEDFLEESDSLITYINKYRKSPIPANYQVKFIEYNWQLNNWNNK